MYVSLHNLIFYAGRILVYASEHWYCFRGLGIKLKEVTFYQRSKLYRMSYPVTINGNQHYFQECFLNNLIVEDKLYFISELETQIGSSNFLTLVILITLILSIFESVVKNECSIGISGVLYGLVAYEMFKFKNIDYNVIYTLVLLFLFSSNSKISHIGHLLGFIAGLTATYLL